MNKNRDANQYWSKDKRVVITIAKLLRNEGLQKGLQKGLQLGHHEEKIETAKHCLDAGAENVV